MTIFQSVHLFIFLGEQNMLADVEVSEDLTEASVKLPAFTSKDLNRKRMCFQSYLFFHQQIIYQTFKIRGEAFWKSRFC